MGQWVKALATKANDLNMIPATHSVEGELTPYTLSPDLRTRSPTHTRK